MSQQDEKQLLESYRKIKQTYDSFVKLQKALGKPKRGFYTSEVSSGDFSGKEMFKRMKRQKERIPLHV